MGERGQAKKEKQEIQEIGPVIYKRAQRHYFWDDGVGKPDSEAV